MLIRTIVVIIVILVIIWLLRRGPSAGHYIGTIQWAPETGLDPEPISILLDNNGNLTGNSRMESPSVDPGTLDAPDTESAWLGKMDSSGAFYIMSYRQGIIPTVFNIPIATNPEYVFVLAGNMRISGDMMESTNARLGAGPLSYRPPEKLVPTLPIVKLSLKRQTPGGILQTF